MNENIKELKEICQSSRWPTDTWHGKFIARPVSIYITLLFLRLGVSANLATGIFVLTGILASFTFTTNLDAKFLIAAILMQFWYILDHVDGEIARYRKQTSFTGMYFDHVAHYIVHPLFFFCLGYGLYQKNYSLFILIWGALAALSTILISVVADSISLFSKNKKSNEQTINKQASDTKLAKKAFSLLHTTCTFPVIIDIFLAMCIFDLFCPYGLLSKFLIYYAILLTFIWINKFSYIILTKKIDRMNS